MVTVTKPAPPVSPTPAGGPAGPGADPRAAEIAAHFAAILRALRLDPDAPDLAGTPRRVARMYLEACAGAEADGRPLLPTVPYAPPRADPFGGRPSQLVAVSDLPYRSLCPHHFLPVAGRAHVAYLPHKLVANPHELARAVAHAARRPQAQERLAEALVAGLEAALRPEGVMVVLQARHRCPERCGPAGAGARTTTTTSAVRGVFGDRRARQEVLLLLNRPA